MGIWADRRQLALRQRELLIGLSELEIDYREERISPLQYYRQRDWLKRQLGVLRLAAGQRGERNQSS